MSKGPGPLPPSSPWLSIQHTVETMKRALDTAQRAAHADKAKTEPAQASKQLYDQVEIRWAQSSQVAQAVLGQRAQASPLMAASTGQARSVPRTKLDPQILASPLLTASAKSDPAHQPFAEMKGIQSFHKIGDLADPSNQKHAADFVLKKLQQRDLDLTGEAKAPGAYRAEVQRELSSLRQEQDRYVFDHLARGQSNLYELDSIAQSRLSSMSREDVTARLTKAHTDIAKTVDLQGISWGEGKQRAQQTMATMDEKLRDFIVRKSLHKVADAVDAARLPLEDMLKDGAARQKLLGTMNRLLQESPGTKARTTGEQLALRLGVEVPFEHEGNQVGALAAQVLEPLRSIQGEQSSFIKALGSKKYLPLTDENFRTQLKERLASMKRMKSSLRDNASVAFHESAYKMLGGLPKAARERFLQTQGVEKGSYLADRLKAAEEKAEDLGDRDFWVGMGASLLTGGGAGPLLWGVATGVTDYAAADMKVEATRNLMGAGQASERELMKHTVAKNTGAVLSALSVGLGGVKTKLEDGIGALGKATDKAVKEAPFLARLVPQRAREAFSASVEKHITAFIKQSPQRQLLLDYGKAVGGKAWEFGTGAASDLLKNAVVDGTAVLTADLTNNTLASLDDVQQQAFLIDAKKALQEPASGHKKFQAALTAFQKAELPQVEWLPSLLGLMSTGVFSGSGDAQEIQRQVSEFLRQ